jgi:hypothetical protein
MWKTYGPTDRNMREAKGKIKEGAETQGGYICQTTKEREKKSLTKHLDLKTDAKQKSTEKHWTIDINTGNTR